VLDPVDITDLANRVVWAQTDSFSDAMMDDHDDEFTSSDEVDVKLDCMEEYPSSTIVQVEPAQLTTSASNESVGYSLLDFPPAPISVDDTLSARNLKSKKIRRKRHHSRSRTSQSEPVPAGRRMTLGRIRTNLNSLHLKELTQDMHIRMMKQLVPTKIPIVQRTITWCKGKW
jgi:hypothetical protein